MNVAFVYMNNECNVGRGAGYVAASVTRAGHRLSFYDTFFTPVEEVARQIVKEKPEVLMLSSMTMIFPDAVRLARLVKKHHNTTVLLGGVHPTILRGKVLEEHPEIDYLCIGEGESMVPEFLNHLNDNSLFEVQNLAFRKDGQVVENPIRPAEDLAETPFFPWDYFPDQAVVQEGQGFLYVNATRGCPYVCTYCANTVYLKQYGKSYVRFRPIDHVVGELDYLRARYSPKLFYFGDEMILSDTKGAIDLFKSIKEHLNVPYGLQGRVEYLNKEVVQILAETGCQYIGMGVETGAEEFRKRLLYRRMSNQQLEDTFKLIKDAGIFVSSFNMIGYPFENDKELTQETLALNQRLKPDYAQVSIFYPFPGTKLFDRCVEKDLIDEDKVATATDYFEDSVLKGVTVKESKEKLNAVLNPNGFRFELKPSSNGSNGNGNGVHGKKVLMLSTDHLTIDRRILQQAKSLKKAGYHVTVVCGFECPEEEHYVEDGVFIHRFGPIIGNGSPSPMAKRVGKRFGINRIAKKIAARQARAFHHQWFYEAAVRNKVDRFKADIVHVHDLPLLWLGDNLAKQWGAELVYDAHEIYYVHDSIPRSTQKLMQQEEKRYTKDAGLFITVNQLVADYFSSQHNKDPLVLLNCADSPTATEEPRQALRSKLGLGKDAQIALYQGWFSPERNLTTLVQAVEHFPANTHLVLIGYGACEDELHATAKSRPWGNRVHFLGKVEGDDLFSLTAGADVGVIPYQPVDLNHEYCSPNKFFEYVQSGVPVVAQDLPFFREMNAKHGVVALGDLSTAATMAQTICNLLSDGDRLAEIKTACFEAAKVLNWETESQKLVDAYAQLHNGANA